MTEEHYDIFDIPTRALVWRRIDVNDDISTVKRVILIIPGNPGIPDFYRKFCKHLFANLEEDIPIITLSHCGHDDNPLIPELEGSEEYFDLQGQIEHKKEFIRKYLSEDCKVILIGHSVGAYIILKMMEDNEINEKVEKSFLLFPVFEKMDETRNGKLLGWIRLFYPFVLFFMWLISLLPSVILKIVLIMLATIFGIPKDYLLSFKKITEFTAFMRVMHMAYNELDTLKFYDKTKIAQFNDKVKFYYGMNDNWIPKCGYFDFKSQYPEYEIEVCRDNIQHAFVLKSSKYMALIVSNWIQELKN